MCTKFLIQDAINLLECIHVPLCTDDLTGFNDSLSVSPVLHVLVCVVFCVCVRACVRARAHVCVCVCVCERERERERERQRQTDRHRERLNNNINNLTFIKFCHV